MARNNAERDADAMREQVMEGQTELPVWLTADSGDQQVAVHDDHYAAQYRRKLRPDELLHYVAAQISQYEDDDPRMALEIAAQVAAGTTVDEVLGNVETTKGKEVLDVILQINGIKFVMSTEASGCPYFAVLDVRNTATNEPDVVTVGGWRLVLQLGQLHYMCTRLDPGDPRLVARDAEGAIAPESYPLFFRIRNKPTNTPGRTINYLARPTD